MQARVDEAYVQFVRDVARGRGASVAAIKSGYGEGRALGAKDAKAAGLIDRIATMDETLARLSGSGKRSAAGMRAEAVLHGIAAHAHAIDASGRLTCGCEWPTGAKAQEMTAALQALSDRWDAEDAGETLQALAAIADVVLADDPGDEDDDWERRLA